MMQSPKQSQFATLFTEHRMLIFKVLNNYLPDQTWHDDLMQDVALRAWKSYDNFRNEYKFSSWIGKIAKYTVIDKLRRTQAQLNRIVKHNAFYEYTYSEIDEPYAESKLPIIDSLSNKEKQTLQYRLDGLTFEQISNLTGEPVNRLLIRMHRIKQRLSKSINTLNYDN